MTFLIGLFIFIFGCIIGSFLNVVSLRYNTGRGVGGRSFCFSCGKTLHWHELIPVLSFVASFGRCRGCKSKISWQYPLVEALTGALFVATFFASPDIFSMLYYWVIWSILIVITVYDLRHQIIPDGLVYTFGVVALAHLFIGLSFFGFFLKMPSATELLSGGLLFLPFFLLWYVSKGTWIGLGDGKLAIGIGFSLGLIDGLSSIVLGFWIGALFAVVVLISQKWLSLKGRRLTMRSEIPFAPFLILGMVLIFFFRWDLLGLHRIVSLLWS